MENTIQKIIDQYFQENNMIDFVIHSYNQLLENIKRILQNYDFKYNLSPTDRLNLIVKDVKLKNSNLNTYIKSVQQRQENLNIQIQIIADLVLTNLKTNSQQEIEFDDFIIDFPIMTNSYIDPILKQTPRQRWDQGQDLCQLGGDLVFNGVPYLVQNTFQYPMNKPVYAPSNQFPVVAFANYLYQKDVMFGNSYYTRYELFNSKENGYDICLYFKQYDSQTKINYIPIMLIFKAYGCKNDQEALQYCNPNNDRQLEYFLINCIRNGFYHKQFYQDSRISKEDALNIIKDLIIVTGIKDDITEQILHKYISDQQTYLYSLGEIVRNLYYAYINNQYSNREALQNKRIFTISQQVVVQLRGAIRTGFQHSMYYLKSISSANFKTEQSKQKIKQALERMSQSTSKTLSNSFVNSNFDTIAPLQKTLNEQKTAIFDIMQKRQVVIRATSMAGELSKDQRMMQQDFYGFLCPIQTPESGSSTGKYNSPCVYSYISISKDPSDIEDYIIHHKLYSKTYKKYYMPIKINYRIIGFVHWDNFKKLYNDLLNYRIKNSLFKEPLWKQEQSLPFYKKNTITSRQNHLFTSIYYSIENQELCINTDAGRIMTPIIKTSTIKSLSQSFTIEKLIQLGKLQYIDVDMIQNFIIQEFSDSKTNYQSMECEWSFLPNGIIGDFPSSSPFCGTLKSLRALYSTSQMKQNISMPYTNPSNQTTNQQLVITQPQSPVIDTTYSRTVYYSKPSLQLVYLIFKAATYNQEDALICNQGYIYRNGSSSNQYKTYDGEKQDQEENLKIKFTIGQTIKNDITLIKYKNTATGVLRNVTYQDTSTKYKYIQISSILKKNPDLIQIQLSRYPTEGDKFVSRNAQKGTIGKIYLEYQMPILDNGIVPTFIQNPDSVLRRETYGQMIEPVMGRQLAESKQLITNYGHDEFNLDLLHNLSKLDQQTMYSNNQIEELKILGGPMMYAPQKHLVSQKIYAVNNAALAKGTRQPAAGRRRHGGIRLGNMEQSALYAQGCSRIIKDMNGINSSNVNWYICCRCGTPNVYKFEAIGENNQQTHYYCQICGYVNDVIINGFSYQQTLLQNILLSAGISLQYSNHNFK